MKLRPSGFAVAFATVAFLCAVLPAAAGPSDPQNVSSESYYDVDPPSGTVTVHVNLTVQNNLSKDLPTVLLWAMPGATDLTVTKDDESLTTKVSPVLGIETMPNSVLATLVRPLKPKARVDLKLAYTVRPQNTELLRLQPGAVEGILISQGPGSFVFIDIPTDGDNYFDPGCLPVADQPADVKAAGKERWVCGEAMVIALSSDDPAVLKQCAGLDDRCRQRFNESPLNAFMQSVTDPSLRGTLETDVQMSDKPVHLVLKYFKHDQAWAARQFDVAQKAFPLLEQAFGYPYPHDTVTMRQSHHIELIGAAGIAFSRIGEVLLATDTGVDDEVTVHELAHQWAGNQLETPWLWEGLAEYGTRVVAPQISVKTRDWGWEKFGYTDALATWYNGSGVRNAYYWYGKSGAFWFAFEEAVGGRDNMRAVLSRMDDDPDKWPLDGEWFMDTGERVSGANLDALVLKWVYNPDTSTPLLKQRRGAHDSVKELTGRAATLGLTGVPTDIQENLDGWVFTGIAGQVAAATRMLDAYSAVVTLATDTGHALPDAVAKSWGVTTTAKTAAVVENQKQALQALIAASDQLASLPEDSPARARLVEAVGQYAAGEFGEAVRLASSSRTDVYNEAAATRYIAHAKEMQSGFRPGWLAKIGMVFADPDGDLAKAEAAYAAHDYGEALAQARSATGSWEGAESRGLLRLAIMCAAMAAFSVFVWWMLRRLTSQDEVPSFADGPGGHVLTPPSEGSRVPSWRDWENTR